MFDHHGSTVAVTHSKTGIESLFKVPMAVTLREVHTCIFAIQGLFKIRCFHIKKKKKSLNSSFYLHGYLCSKCYRNTKWSLHEKNIASEDDQEQTVSSHK